MGNFSLDPNARAADALDKQYVSVRLQQAVPLLDADWNLLEDLRRLEHEVLGKWFIGSGVPPGSDGFHISAIAQLNDFSIHAGLCLVSGKLTSNPVDVHYTTQPNFGKLSLPPLTAPPADKAFIVYLDVWEREVDSEEDTSLVDSRIGVETAVRLKREWAVRVARVPEDVPALDAPPLGHFFLRLARLNRKAGDVNITASMIEDLRDTQLSVQRKVEARDNTGNIIVDNQRFRQMLSITRDRCLEFARYITTQFNPPVLPLVSVEILGLQTMNDVAHTAQAGLAQSNALSLANQGALAFLRQLYDAQQNFLTVWKESVLKLGAAVKKYASYQNFITRLDERLNNPIVPGSTLLGLLPALNAGNLIAATDTQEEIARLIGSAAQAIPRGSIQVSYSNAPPGNLLLGQLAQFQFRVRSFTTLADTYTVRIQPDVGWLRFLVDGSGNPVPNNKVPIGPGGAETTLFVNVTVQAGSSQLQLRLTSDSNPAEIDQTTGLLNLTVGQPAPPPEDKIQFGIGTLFRAEQNPVTGVLTVQKPPASQPADIGIRIFNGTGEAITMALAVEVVPNTQVGNWTVTRLGPDNLALGAGQNAQPGGVRITAFADSAAVLVSFTATATVAGATVKSQIVVSIAAVAAV